MKIRLTGTETEVEQAAELIGGLFTVLETSRLYPRRDSQLVSLYIEAELPDRTEGQVK
ncbi:hypothetical protein [Actinocorallia libanotica]|uniref:Uncharacterized protein n=1 Tax=Actinocorallia libanotica TaxID=46162 RepID=A0ABP4CH38_9ACTN